MNERLLRYPLLFSLLIALALSSCTNKSNTEVKESQGDQGARPNIIIIFADDMGYGDIGAYNEQSLIPTPNLDQLASEGIRFTDAHTSSAVCTPSRYSLLTGRYAWRSSLKSGVLDGYSPLLIESDTKTLPSLLKDQGYHTAIIGKWHLGLGNAEADYFNQALSSKDALEKSAGLTPGPNDVGFDYFFGIPASLDMPPYVYLENDAVFTHTPLNGDNIDASKRRRTGGGGFWRKGPIGEGFAHEQVLPDLTERTLNFIQSQTESANVDRPFFLYFSLPAPHTPWLPTAAFRGKSGAGHYGDFSHQVDDVVGQVTNALEQGGIADNTLVIFTSDNGANWYDADIEKYGHRANGNLRGQKADIYEGGHRVPFIARWPGHFAKNRVSEQPTVLTDLMATLAAIVDIDLEDDVAVDSFDISSVLLGTEKQKIERAAMVHHSFNGTFAVREGDWKLLLGLGSGGFTHPKKVAPAKGQSEYRLYNLREDILESNDLAAEHPEIVQRLLYSLEKIKADGRSR